MTPEIRYCVHLDEDMRRKVVRFRGSLGRMLALAPTGADKSKTVLGCNATGQPVLGSTMGRVLMDSECILGFPSGALALGENGTENLRTSILAPMWEQLDQQLENSKSNPWPNFLFYPIHDNVPGVYDLASVSNFHRVVPTLSLSIPKETTKSNAVRWSWETLGRCASFGPGGYRVLDIPTAVVSKIAITALCPTPLDREVLKSRPTPEESIEMMIRALECSIRELLLSEDFNIANMKGPCHRPRADTPIQSGRVEKMLEWAMDARVSVWQTCAALHRMLDATRAVLLLIQSGEIQIPPAQLVPRLVEVLLVVAWVPPSTQALKNGLASRAGEYEEAVEYVKTNLPPGRDDFARDMDNFLCVMRTNPEEALFSNDNKNLEQTRKKIQDLGVLDLRGRYVTAAASYTGRVWLDKFALQHSTVNRCTMEELTRVRSKFLSVLRTDSWRDIFCSGEDENYDVDLAKMRLLIEEHPNVLKYSGNDWSINRLNQSHTNDFCHRKTEQRAVGGAAAIETATTSMRTVDTRTTEEELKEAIAWMKFSGDTWDCKFANHLWAEAVRVGTRDGWKQKNENSRQIIQTANENADIELLKTTGYNPSQRSTSFYDPEQDWASADHSIVWIKAANCKKRKHNCDIFLGNTNGPFPDKSWAAIKSNKLMFDMSNFVQSDQRKSSTPSQLLIRQFASENSDIIHRVKEGTTRPVWVIQATDHTFIVAQFLRFTKKHQTP